ncbi:MAG TPA: protein kinase [Thermoanaerobaculia bacterium]|nr:protein kinase [Thermoanaerobaculia bacterium]
MTISGGTRLGAYEILAPLGAGGMGEVYRARDTKLDRDVAVKVLPQAVAGDPDTLARFEREAKAVAALSHPNILSIFDFGAHDGVAYAVMELLEGETLRSKLAGGAIAPRKAVEYALQIAHGLAAAHERGIVHRDLKPENVFVSRDGRVRILDFGLAKRVDAVAADAPTSAPTGSHHTAPGTVMGTVSYMSPEQVKGLAVDHRSDVFSFGAVLYEMLSGERAFKRDTAPETLTAILREEPAELSGANRRVDPALDGLVRHCLEKSPEERFQSARDLAYALSTLGSSSGNVSGATGRVRVGAVRAPRRIGVLGGLAAGLLLGALAAGVFLRPKAAEPPDFQVLTYSGNDTQPTTSPDGKTIAFMSSRDGTNRIWLMQRAGGGEGVLTGGPNDIFPRFSPDGSSLLFTRIAGESAIYRVPIVGGEARKIVGPALAADWSPDGREIAFLRGEARAGKLASSIHRIGVDGANERLVAKVPDRALTYLRWSPDGRTLAAFESAGTGTERQKIVLYPLDGKPPRYLETPEAATLLGFAWNGDSRSLILLARASDAPGGSRTTRVFLKDTSTARVRLLLSGIDLRNSVAVLGSGSLVLVTGGPRSNLREVSLVPPGEGGRWLTRGSSVDRQPIYAPDGEWVAFASTRSGNLDVWEVSTKSGAVRRLTEDPADDFDPAFTRDGKRLMFSSSRSGHFEIWMAERDGSGARRITNDGVDAENPVSTPDDQWIVYASGNPEKRGLWKVRPDGSEASRLVAGTATLPEISPDGKFVSYMDVKERGRVVRVARFEDGVRVPFELTASGLRPNTGRHRWTPDGGALVVQMENEKGDLGIATQDFVPDRDTAASRRFVTGFTPDSWAETLGVAPDGKRLTVSVLQDPSSLLLVQGVEGVVARPAPGAGR